MEQAYLPTAIGDLLPAGGDAAQLHGISSRGYRPDVGALSSGYAQRAGTSKTDSFKALEGSVAAG